jgi:PAS domain S-box-containing protein
VGDSFGTSLGSQAAALAAVAAAADACGIGFAVTTASADELAYLAVNDVALRILGYPRERLMRMSPLDVVAPEDLARLQERRAARLAHGAEGAARHDECTVVQASGRRVRVEYAAADVVVDGRPAVVSFFFDTDERGRAQRALTASELRFRALIDAAADAVAIVQEGRIAYVNRRGLDLVGFRSLADAVGRPLEDIVHADDLSVARERIGRALATGTPNDEAVEYRFLRQDGGSVHVESVSTPIEYNGAPAVVAFARDITERKAMQAQLALADRLSALGRLSAGVAHEINNPLSWVLLSVRMIERQLPELCGNPALLPSLKERIGEIVQGLERVARIAHDLRSFSRPEQGPLGPVDLTEVLAAAVKVVAPELRGARIVERYEAAAPVSGNPVRLEQVFVNLLVNASEALPDERRDRHEVRLWLREAPDGRVAVDVADTGRGIAPEAHARIFEPFYSSKPIGSGTGLGLAISRSIVTALGGDITVRSAPGEGTTFTVVFRKWQGTGADADARISSLPPEQEGAVRPRLLVLDDEPQLLHTLERLLGDLFDMRVESDAQPALAWLAQGAAVDVILCDVRMPEMGGVEFHDALRARRPELCERIVFMTGATGDPKSAAALAALPNRLVEKPFDVERLRRLLLKTAGR